MTIFYVLWRKETRVCQQNCFLHSVVNDASPLSCSELDVLTSSMLNSQKMPASEMGIQGLNSSIVVLYI